jgi:hypothetical protein
MATMLRITSILLAVTAGLAAANVPAAAQDAVAKKWAEQWKKSCVAELRKKIWRPVDSLEGAASYCCLNQKKNDANANCENLKPNDTNGRSNCGRALDICKNDVIADQDLSNAIAKAKKEEAEKEKAEKEKAEKAEKEKTAAKGSGKTNCETFNGNKYVVWKAGEFTRQANGRCQRTFMCISTLQEPFSALCRPVPSQPQSLVQGNCNDPQRCTDCKAPPPTAECTATFVQR